MNEKVKNLRKYLHRTQEEMAADLGYTCGMISKCERGEVPIGLEFISRISDHYGVDEGYFFGEISLEDAVVSNPDIDWKEVGK